MDSSDEETTSQDESLPLWHRQTSQRRVPSFVLVSTLFIMMLQSFIFYATWWRLVPFVRYHIPKELDPTDITSTVAVQIFMLVHNMAPILWGLVSDVKHTRYDIVYIFRSVFCISYAIFLVLKYQLLEERVAGYLLGFLIFVMAASSGICTTTMVVFAIEQLDDPDDRQTRSSLVRWISWVGSMGSFLAYWLHRFDPEYGVITDSTVMITSIITIPLFIAWKKFYKFNDLNGSKTLRNLKIAVRQWMGKEEDDDDEEDENFWQFNPSDSEQDQDHEQLERLQLVADHRSVLLKRLIFLFLIFFICGSYYAFYFFAVIIYSIQVEHYGFQYYGPSMGSLVNTSMVLVTIPIMDVIMCKLRLNGDKTSFVFIALSMLLGVVSILISTWDFDQVRMILAFIFFGLSKMLFFIGGFSLAFAESPRHLRGTIMGSFLGLGSFFGAIIYFVWLLLPPAGVTGVGWWRGQVMVGSILGVTLCFLYLPVIYVYNNVKNHHKQISERLFSQILPGPDVEAHTMNVDQFYGV